VLETATIEMLGIFVACASVLALVGRWFRLPSLVAYILAGLLLGPVTGLVVPRGETREAAHLLGQIGIVLLMFVVGLELSLERIREVGRVAVIAGLGQVAFTAAGGTAIAWFLGYDLLTALFVGVALTFSSTVVVVKVLDDKGELDTLYGRIAVGIFLVQDIVVIVALTVLTGLAGAGGDPSWQSVGGGVGRAFLAMSSVLASCLLAARYVLPRPFEWVAGAGPALLVWSTAWCFLVVASALGLGLSPEIGGLLAGFSLAQLPTAGELRRRVHPLMSFFILVFFVSLGAEMPLGQASQHLVAAVVLSLFVLVGNPLLFVWIIARTGFGARTAFLSGVTVAQISEFSFVFVAMGISSGLIEPGILSLVGVVGLVTIVGSVYLILYNRQLYEIIAPTGALRVLGAREREDEDEDEDPQAPRGHVIVVGMNDLGRAIVSGLVAEGVDVLAIDTDPVKLRALGSRTLVGDIDHLSTLADARIEEARLAVSALRIDDVNQLFVWRCRRLGVAVVVHGADRIAVDLARSLGPDWVLDSKEEAAHRTLSRIEALGLVVR
jgi:Kef-type K+ transport system membrane component KefB